MELSTTPSSELHVSYRLDYIETRRHEAYHGTYQRSRRNIHRFSLRNELELVDSLAIFPSRCTVPDYYSHILSIVQGDVNEGETEGRLHVICERNDPVMIHNAFNSPAHRTGNMNEHRRRSIFMQQNGDGSWFITDEISIITSVERKMIRALTRETRYEKM